MELGEAVRKDPSERLREGQRVHCYSAIPRAGTWAEYVSIAAKNCTPLPDAMNDVDGSQVQVTPCTDVIEMCKAGSVRTINLVRRGRHVEE